MQVKFSEFSPTAAARLQTIRTKRFGFALVANGWHARRHLFLPPAGVVGQKQARTPLHPAR
jgi:hypothetical protein